MKTELSDLRAAAERLSVTMTMATEPAAPEPTSVLGILRILIDMIDRAEILDTTKETTS